MTCRERLESYLRENRVPFQVQHKAQAFTTQEVAQRGHVLGRLMAKA